jgi:hypothetical protein
MIEQSFAFIHPRRLIRELPLDIPYYLKVAAQTGNLPSFLKKHLGFTFQYILSTVARISGVLMLTIPVQSDGVTRKTLLPFIRLLDCHCRAYLSLCQAFDLRTMQLLFSDNKTAELNNFASTL